MGKKALKGPFKMGRFLSLYIIPHNSVAMSHLFLYFLIKHKHTREKLVTFSSKWFLSQSLTSKLAHYAFTTFQVHKQIYSCLSYSYILWCAICSVNSSINVRFDGLWCRLRLIVCSNNG